jgi:hypothetical protein
MVIGDCWSERAITGTELSMGRLEERIRSWTVDGLFTRKNCCELEVTGCVRGRPWFGADGMDGSENSNRVTLM